MESGRSPHVSPGEDSEARSTCLCKKCGRKIRFKAQYYGKTIPCPKCRNPLLLVDEAEVQTDEPKRMDWVSPLIGWGSSVVLHALLLISFTGITWWSGLGSGSHAREAGLLLEDAGVLEFSDTSIDAPDLPSYDPPLPDSTELSPYDPIDDLGGGELPGDSGEDMMLDEPIGGGMGATGSDMDIFLPGGNSDAGNGMLFGGIEDTGEAVVYVIDRSGSMRWDGRLNDAKWELQESVRRLAPNQKFYIIFYSTDTISMEAGGLVTATPGNKDRYLAWAQDSIQPSGYTDPIPAMRKALSLRPDVIYLLTDGVFTSSSSTLIPDDEVCEAIRQANPKVRDVLQTAVNTIAFHDNRGEGVLKRIAGENDGTYRFCTQLSRR